MAGRQSDIGPTDHIEESSESRHLLRTEANDMDVEGNDWSQAPEYSRVGRE